MFHPWLLLDLAREADPDLDRLVAVKVPRAGTLASRTDLEHPPKLNKVPS